MASEPEEQQIRRTLAAQALRQLADEIVAGKHSRITVDDEAMEIFPVPEEGQPRKGVYRRTISFCYEV